MLRHTIVLVSRKSLCCLFLVSLAVSLLSWPAWAEEPPLPATGKQPADGPDLKTDIQLFPAQAAPAVAGKSGTAQPQSPAPLPVSASSSPASTLPDPKDAPIVYGPPGSQMPWAAPPTFAPCCNLNDGQDPSDMAIRFGWWATQQKGSPWVVGQWQDTHSSPFWDVDGLWTNGVRTFNYSATGTDNESTRAIGQLYGPNGQASFLFNRFIHAQENEPLTNFNNMIVNSPANNNGINADTRIVPDDFNAGQNMAMRVDQFESKLQANLTDRLKLGVNIWEQREFGNRDADSTNHCFLISKMGLSQTACHVVSQTQHIDWNTFEITPTLDYRGDKFNIQYSHTLRVFRADDQDVTMDYGTLATGSGLSTWLNGVLPVDVVPSSVFNEDKIKLAIDIADHTKFYGFGYVGEVENNDVGVQREFGGVDLRLTNTSFKGLSVTAYGKNYNQSGETPTSALPASETLPATGVPLTPTQVQNLIPNPYGFNRYTTGIKGSYRPWAGASCDDSWYKSLSFTAGYEYEYLIRVNQDWYEATSSGITPTTRILYQPNTTTQTLNFGVQSSLSSDLYAYLRYKLQFIDGALLGFTPDNGNVNSSLPDLRNVFEFGCEWFPSTRFGGSFNQEINLSGRHGSPTAVNYGYDLPASFLDFGENTYSSSLVLWYRPTDKWTLTGDANYFYNKINQYIALADSSTDTGTPSSNPTYPTLQQWNYGGTAVVLGCNANYAITRCVRLTAGYEISDGTNRINPNGFTSNPYLPVSYVSGYSDVRNVMQTVSVGVDWKPRKNFSGYLRYNLLDFDDLSNSGNSGRLNSILGGMCVRF